MKQAVSQKPKSGAQFLIFQVNEQSYALPLLELDQVLQMMEIRSEGSVVLRGECIQVEDLRKHFNFKRDFWPWESRIVMVYFNGQKRGLIVDRVREIQFLEDIGGMGRLASGEMIPLLNLKKILGSEGSDAH